MNRGLAIMIQLVRRGATELGLIPAEICVLQQLCLHDFGYGNPIFPSERRIAEGAGITERQVRRAKNALRSKGLLSWSGRPPKACCYSLDVLYEWASKSEAGHTDNMSARARRAIRTICPYHTDICDNPYGHLRQFIRTICPENLLFILLKKEKKTGRLRARLLKGGSPPPRRAAQQLPKTIFSAQRKA